MLVAEAYIGCPQFVRLVTFGGHKLDLPIPTQMTDYMIEDRQHNLWVTQGENGIYRLSADNKSKHFSETREGNDHCGPL